MRARELGGEVVTEVRHVTYHIQPWTGNDERLLLVVPQQAADEGHLREQVALRPDGKRAEVGEGHDVVLLVWHPLPQAVRPLVAELAVLIVPRMDLPSGSNNQIPGRLPGHEMDERRHVWHDHVLRRWLGCREQVATC